jgi:opacity protein-like surface antigen
MPYVGLSYSYSELSENDFWTYSDGSWSRYDFESTNKDRWGVPLGVQAQLTDNLGLVLSGTLLGREEIGLSLSWDF